MEGDGSQVGVAAVLRNEIAQVVARSLLMVGFLCSFDSVNEPPQVNLYKWFSRLLLSAVVIQGVSDDGHLPCIVCVAVDEVMQVRLSASFFKLRILIAVEDVEGSMP